MPCADSVLKKMIYNQVSGGAKPPQPSANFAYGRMGVYHYLLNFRRHTGLDHVTY